MAERGERSATATATATVERSASAAPALSDSEMVSGILPAQLIAAAAQRGDIVSARALDDDQIQPASLDLRLGAEAYRVPASFLPGPGTRVEDKLHRFAVERVPLDSRDGAVLQRGQVYLVPLQEGLRLRARWSAAANPKSSTGRLDVFARLITDGATEFDAVGERYNGPLWLEVAPRSFDVRVREGSRLAQLRLRYGRPRTSDRLIRSLNAEARLVHDAQEDEEGGGADIKQGMIALSVDLAGDPDTGRVGYRARRGAAPLDVDRVDAYDPSDYWAPIDRPPPGDGLILQPDEFFILASKEKVSVPHDFAADMVAYDTLVGEFRVHYAGFFDPGFGYAGGEPVGAKIVLEVRSHEVPFLVDHGQIMGRVLFERLSQPTDRPYGSGIGSNYQGQALALSKQFRR